MSGHPRRASETKEESAIVLRAGDRFENPKTGAVLEILHAPGADGGALEVRRTIKPGTGKTLAHLHRDFVERFVVESGVGLAKVDGVQRQLLPGGELEVRVGQPHVNAYNPGRHDLVVLQSFEPASDFALAYVETLAHMMRRGAADRQGEVPVLAAFAIGHATSSKTYAAGVPEELQRTVVFPLGARLARLGDYDLRVPQPRLASGAATAGW